MKTEGDTLADMLKQDYGDFSDSLRKAFQHEPITLFRRNNSEDIDIPHPKLSCILSSTFDQLLKLIPNIENGLFSRFMYYELKPNTQFKDVFAEGKSGYWEYFQELGEEVKKIYDVLAPLEVPIWFELQSHQKEKFVNTFRHEKSEFKEVLSDKLGGTVNRLGLICFRIAMVLSTLRTFENGDISNRIVCDDSEFESALEIMHTLKMHSLTVYEKLPKPAERNIIKKEPISSDVIDECKRMRQAGVSYRDIGETLFGSDKNYSSKVYYLINGRE